MAATGPKLGFDLGWDAQAGVGNDIAAFEVGDSQPSGRKEGITMELLKGECRVMSAFLITITF